MLKRLFLFSCVSLSLFCLVGCEVSELDGAGGGADQPANLDRLGVYSEVPEGSGKEFFLSVWRKPGLPEISGGEITSVNEGSTEKFVAFMLTSPKSVRETADFYESELKQLGWKTRKSSTIKEDYYSGVHYKDGARITIVGMPGVAGRSQTALGVDIKM